MGGVPLHDGRGGNVTPQELESAAQELDERTYTQELDARFQHVGVGRAYFAFDSARNVRNVRFDSRVSLSWALDFNMNPFCSVLAQVANGMVYVLEEMILPDSNTAAACEEFLSRTKKYACGMPLSIDIYGDATAEQRRTSASRTDWQIVMDFFGRYKDQYHARFHVPSANPAVKDRINCVNAKLLNHAGQSRLFVNVSCKHLIKDFEQGCWKTDPHGDSLADINKSESNEDSRQRCGRLSDRR